MLLLLDELRAETFLEDSRSVCVVYFFFSMSYHHSAWQKIYLLHVINLVIYMHEVEVGALVLSPNSFCQDHIYLHFFFLVALFCVFGFCFFCGWWGVGLGSDAWAMIRFASFF